MEEANSYMEQIINIMGRVKAEFDSCSAELGRLDREAQVVLHTIELERFNVVRGYQMAKQLKDIRCRRREIKNQATLLHIILGNLKKEDLASLNKKLIAKQRDQETYGRGEVREEEKKTM